MEAGEEKMEVYPFHLLLRTFPPIGNL